MFVHRTASSGRLAQLADRYQAPLASAFAILLLLALHRSFNFVTPHYDAGEYWKLAALDQLYDLPSLRGYVFPVLLAPVRYLTSIGSSPMLMYRGSMSLIYGVLLTTVLPAAFQQAFGGKITLARRLVPVVLLAAVFPGLLMYPLSDLPALLLTFSALLCLLWARDPASSMRQFLCRLFGAGFLLGAAYNTRTIYLFAAIPLSVLAALAIRRQWAQKSFPPWLGVTLFLLGLLTVSLPQLVINQRAHGVNSFAVQSLVNSRSLFANQLAWGMTLQRYETTLDDALGVRVYYFDPAGARLLERVAGGGDLFTLSYYLKVASRNPLDFLALYSRHVINGLDVRDGLVYTHKPSPKRNMTAFVNFLVLALAVLVAASVRRHPGQPVSSGFGQGSGRQALSLAVLIFPVAAIVPGAIETRYFLPVHLLAYCVIAMHFDSAKLRRMWSLHAGSILLALAVAAGVFFAVTLNTMANIQYEWPEIYSNPPPG